MSVFKKELFVCQCESIEHQLIFMYDKDENDDKFDEVYCEIYLSNYMNFWQRLKHGIKYIFGFKSKYGAFDSIILNPEDYKRFQDIADKLTEAYHKSENRKLLTGKD